MCNRLAGVSLVLMACILLPGQTCVTVTNVVPDGGDDTSSTDLTIRFINATGRAVDVQFYATGQAVYNVDTDLFVAANQVTANIGFAGSGLLDSGGTDQITLTCANAAVIGTQGGRFLDANTGALLGTGRQLVLFSGLQYGCGDVITITFSESGGTFTTGLSVQ